MNIDELVEKSKSRPLNDLEAKFIREELSRENIKDSKLYALLYAAGRGFRTDLEKTIASYLDYTKDPMIVRLSLQILCAFWGKHEAYKEYITGFLNNKEWDEDQDVFLMAISCAGEYCRKNIDKAMIAKLLSIYSDFNSDAIIRQAAFTALARSQGKDWNTLPTPTNLIEFDSDETKDTIERAEKMANE